MDELIDAYNPALPLRKAVTPPSAWVEQVCEGIRPLMSGAATLDVPLVVEAGVGSNWDEAH